VLESLEYPSGWSLALIGNAWAYNCPGAVRPITNLALAWITLRRYADGESAARRAIAADPGCPPARRALSLARSHRLLVPSETANDNTN
jgi:hypothetical protein